MPAMPCNEDDDDGNTSTGDPLPDSLHAQPKAKRSNAEPVGEGVLSDHATHASHASQATCACGLPRSSEQIHGAAAIASHSFCGSVFVTSLLLQHPHEV
jgi:hypothetical protein